MVITSNLEIKEILMKCLQIEKHFPQEKYNRVRKNEEHQKVQIFEEI